MSLERYFNKRFRFRANRFEEWQGGRCISGGEIDLEILAVDNGNVLSFTLDSTRELRITSSFEFNKRYSSMLPDRIQYIRSSDFNPEEPVVCHLFVKNDELRCVRFAMTNPDRIIEFYGSEITSAESFSKVLFDFLGW